jgi:hypothetical protein
MATTAPTTMRPIDRPPPSSSPSYSYMLTSFESPKAVVQIHDRVRRQRTPRPPDDKDSRCSLQHRPIPPLDAAREHGTSRPPMLPVFSR